MKTKTLFSILLLAVASLTFSSCREDADKLRQEYQRGEHDSRIIGSWEAEEPFYFGGSYVDVIKFDSEGGIVRYMRNPETKDLVEVETLADFYYYTKNNKELYVLEVPRAGNKQNYGKSYMDYELNGNILKTALFGTLERKG